MIIKHSKFSEGKNLAKTTQNLLKDIVKNKFTVRTSMHHCREGYIDFYLFEKGLFAAYWTIINGSASDKVIKIKCNNQKYWNYAQELGNTIEEISQVSVILTKNC